jgi:hypothetical protein
MKAIDKLWMGIDWGTHSSKWVCLYTQVGHPIAGGIHNSTIVRANDALIFSKGQDIDIADGDVTIEGLKGKIILDPLGQSFWNADRLDTQTSMGQAVTFSFCCLLGDIAQVLEADGYSIHPETNVEIGFSLPNWLRDEDDASRAALSHFHEAATVACWILRAGSTLPTPGVAYPIQAWKEIVGGAQRSCLPADKMITIDTLAAPI